MDSASCCIEIVWLIENVSVRVSRRHIIGRYMFLHSSQFTLGESVLMVLIIIEIIVSMQSKEPRSSFLEMIERNI